MRSGEPAAAALAALALMAADGLGQDLKRLGSWEPPSMSKEPWKRHRKNRDSNGPGGPAVRLRIPGRRR